MPFPHKRTSLFLIVAVTLLLFVVGIASPAAAVSTSDLVITGVVDGPLTGGIPKAVEFYVLNDIADLSDYGFGSANNGGGSDGEEFTFPSVAATAGTYIYVASESTGFTSFFGFAPDYTSSAASINGDDAIELFQSGSVVDVFGDINVDGSGKPWEYLDGWAYRVNGTGPDGSTFVLANWTFSGPNALDGETSNDTAATPFPIGSYSPTVPDMLITGVVDGPLTGGIPKAVEFYVLNDIADLSDYGFGSANNGGGSDGEEFTFPSVAATAGTYIYVASESPSFTSFFGFAPDYTSSAALINGDDAVELFQSGSVVDVFGDINVDGSGQPWEYTDGWAYRKHGTGPDGSTFVLANWIFSGPDALDGEITNDTAAVPFPIGTYLPPGADFPPTVASTIPTNGATSFPPTADVTINFSEAVTVTDPWFDIDCTPTGAVTASVSGGPESFVLDLGSDLVDGETCTVTVKANQVVDQDDTPNNMVEDYVFSFSTPPMVNIHEIQGTPDNQGIYYGRPDASPLRGDVVKVEAIVVADFQGLPGPEQLDAFFVQEEDADVDADDRSSEGILVYCGSTCPTDVVVGQKVQVTGLVEEWFGMTQLRATSSSDVIVISNGNPLPSPAAPDLPVVGDVDVYYEQFEGMLVNFSDTLIVSEYYQLARFGQLVMTVDARAHQFTDANEPDVAGYAAFLDDLSSKRIILDDDNNIGNDALGYNPVDDKPYFWPRSGLSISNYIRGGDSITNLTGVLHWSYAGGSNTDAWRVRPVEEEFTYDFTSNILRPVQPDPVGGTLKIASFNVLNYFTTLDTGSSICGPLADQGCRGANSLAEFDRQRTKIITAIVEIDADVIGLMEIENNPADPTDVPLDDLVAGLNAAAGVGTYAYIDTGSIGSDAIKVALIYKTATVSPVGNYAILDSSVDSRFNDDKNRPTLAQTFEEPATGGKLTVAVNHLKSKGSSCASIGDPDLYDGQANCNLTRTDAAAAMADWLAADPTASGDADVLIIGDLNSYRKEDPIDALVVDAGYTDLLDSMIGPTAYSYLFDGQLGYLDHALSNGNLFGQVQGTTVWQINADEIPLFDYNDDIEDPGESWYERESIILPIYETNAFRASDHDPVLVGLDLNGSPVCTAAAPSIDKLWPVNHKFVLVYILGITDPEGDPITIVIDSIFQDEEVIARGSGKTAPDGQGIGTSTAEVRAERAALENGRYYHIFFTASDDHGNSCTGEVPVYVPLNLGRKTVTIDDGPLYDSTVSP